MHASVCVCTSTCMNVHPCVHTLHVGTWYHTPVSVRVHVHICEHTHGGSCVHIRTYAEMHLHVTFRCVCMCGSVPNVLSCAHVHECVSATVSMHVWVCMFVGSLVRLHCMCVPAPV